MSWSTGGQSSAGWREEKGSYLCCTLIFRIASCNWETAAVQTALYVALDVHITFSGKKMVTQQQQFSGATVHLTRHTTHKICNGIEPLQTTPGICRANLKLGYLVNTHLFSPSCRLVNIRPEKTQVFPPRLEVLFTLWYLWDGVTLHLLARSQKASQMDLLLWRKGLLPDVVNTMASLRYWKTF